MLAFRENVQLCAMFVRSWALCSPTRRRAAAAISSGRKRRSLSSRVAAAGVAVTKPLKVRSEQPQGFLSIATTALSAARKARLDSGVGDALQAGGQLTTSGSSARWVDDDTADELKLQQHVQSEEYRELHRPGLTNAAMGLFGGEPGFEKAHRIWVDPDRPHMKHIYNTTALAKNLRYARYGYFKREMHLLDIDKLVRHARMLPVPQRLLTDFLYQGVALDDSSCAAILRYQRHTLEKLADADSRVLEFPKLQEMFERLLSTNVPPVDVGVESHAEAIRSCALCSKWEEGWNQYHSRAVELEAAFTAHDAALLEGEVRASHGAGAFVLTGSYFDAVIALCVACERPVEGYAVFREMLQRRIRPRRSTLDNVMLLVALWAEKSDDGSAGFRGIADADDVWSLYDIFERQPTTSSVLSRMRACAVLGAHSRAIEALKLADQLDVKLDEECLVWLLYSLLRAPGMSSFVVDVLAESQRRALAITYRTLTYALMYCAHHGDGDTALQIYQTYGLALDLNITPEVVLLLLQSFRRCQSPTIHMILGAEDALRRIEQQGTACDLRQAHMEEFVELCAALGAVATASSTLKTLVARGDPLTPRTFNAVLRANARAQPPNGSYRTTDELVQIMALLRVPVQQNTLAVLDECVAAHGTTPDIDKFIADARKRRKKASSQSERGSLVHSNDDVPPFHCPPTHLRVLKSVWNIVPDDIALKKFGQNRPARPKDDGQVQLSGSVVPFGKWPGMTEA